MKKIIIILITKGCPKKFYLILSGFIDFYYRTLDIVTHIIERLSYQQKKKKNCSYKILSLCFFFINILVNFCILGYWIKC